MQTAVNWLIEQIKNDQNQKALTGLEWMKVIEQAKEMEKQQIIDAYLKDRRQVTIDKALMIWDKAEQYYQETFVSKGSDELSKVAKNTNVDHIVDTNKMI